jgi:hypothetical protein
LKWYYDLQWMTLKLAEIGIFTILSLARLPIPPHRQPIKSTYFWISDFTHGGCNRHPRTSEPDLTFTNRNRNETLSTNLPRRFFPKFRAGLQYVSNGKHYGRIRLNGKLIRVNFNPSVCVGGLAVRPITGHVPNFQQQLTSRNRGL